ncbi:MAG: helix-turn-helix domain-containing protein [Cyclobacteriaceae bacterium]
MSILFLLAGIGVVNGIFTSIYLFINRSAGITDLYFAGLIMMLSIRIAKSIFYYFNREADLLILQIGLSACIFIGPFFYLYMRSIYRKVSQWHSKEIILLLTLLIVITLTGIIYPYRIYPDLWNSLIIKGIYLIWSGFTIAGIYLFIKISKKRDQYTDNFFFLVIVVAAMVFITITYHLALYAGITYIWGSLIFSATFYAMVIRLFIGRRPVTPNFNKEPVENGAEILLAVDLLVQREQLYKEKGMKLDQLARKAGISRNILSRIMNENYGHGFSHFIRKYRIEEAKKLILTRPELSFEGIGYESGFHSKSTFFEAFKKSTGLTPSAYKKQHLS